MLGFGLVRITVSHRVRGSVMGRIRVRDRVRFRDRDRRSEAVNFGAN